MITLRKIAAEIRRLESGGDLSADSQLSEAYVVLMCRQVLNKMLAPRIWEKKNEEDRSTMHLMVATYIVDVESGSEDDDASNFITLPDFYQLLPFNEGLVGIAPVYDPTNYFLPRLTPSVTRGLECALLEEGQNSYWSKGFKVFFDDSMDLEKVMVDLLVAAPDQIGIDDPLPIYAEMQADLIQGVRQLLKGSPPQDKRLDNNADMGIKTPIK